ncbi:MAG: response regulator transcription factor, partial [Vicinamibacterales bacterium]
MMAESDQRENPLILAVEDDPDIQRLIARRLREAGFEVITATTAGDGFVLFGERIPDLIMLDLNLPDGSGLGLVRQVRASS